MVLENKTGTAAGARAVSRHFFVAFFFFLVLGVQLIFSNSSTILSLLSSKLISLSLLVASSSKKNLVAGLASGILVAAARILSCGEYHGIGDYVQTLSI